MGQLAITLGRKDFPVTNALAYCTILNIRSKWSDVSMNPRLSDAEKNYMITNSDQILIFASNTTSLFNS